MKKYTIAIIIIVIAGLFISCSQEDAIEETILAFENAVNLSETDLDVAANDLEGIMSPDSDFYVTTTFADFLFDNFDQLWSVNYTNLDITADGRDGDVYSDATYLAGTIPDDVWFWMRREKGFFAFLNPDWRVFRYYNGGDYTIPVWQKLKDKAVPVE